MDTRFVYPRELRAGMVVIERTERGKATRYPVSAATNNACSSPDTTHVAVNGNTMWCYDNTAKVEVVL